MSRLARSDLTDIEVHLHHETHAASESDGAFLVSLDGDRKSAVWVPKCAAQFERKTLAIGILTLRESLAIEKGLV